ncbi:MAG: hypothetical protein WEB53_08415 [Akkermansiaceae bacterium]
MAANVSERFLLIIAEVVIFGGFAAKSAKPWAKNGPDFFTPFGLAIADPGISLRIRFSFCWQTVGAPVSVSISTFRGKCQKENEPTTQPQTK